MLPAARGSLEAQALGAGREGATVSLLSLLQKQLLEKVL
jgi:hypothetical protein